MADLVISAEMAALADGLQNMSRAHAAEVLHLLAKAVEMMEAELSLFRGQTSLEAARAQISALVLEALPASGRPS